MRGMIFALSVALVLAACTGDTRTSGPATSPEPSASPSPTRHVARAIEVFRDVNYLSEPEGGKGSSLLDVYAPTDAGPWPVVVMLHGGGETKDGYEGWATKAAKRGAVVFVPTWSRMNNDVAATLTPREVRASLVTAISDIAAAVRFARGTATSYGGDPEHLTLFGHSFGAMGATMEAFSGAPASTSGLEGAGSTIPESLVVFDPDYLLASFSDDFLASDPGLMHVFTPWDYLGRQVDFPVTMLDSVTPELGRDASDVWVEGSWLAVRDPSGELRRGLELLGAFEVGTYLNGAGMKLFAERLRADGDTVTYVTLTDSTHWKLGDEGMESLLGALVPDASASTSSTIASPTASSSGASTVASAAPSMTGDMATFTSAGPAYSFNYPSSWKKVEGKPSHPVTLSPDLGPNWVELTLDEVHPGTTLDTYERVSRMQATKWGFVVDTTHQATMGGQPALVIECTKMNAMVLSRIAQFFTINGGYAYMLTLNGPDDSFAADYRTVASMAESFRFGD